MSIAALSELMLCREMAFILADQLALESAPLVSVNVLHDQLHGRTELVVKWGGQQYRARIDESDLRRSLDDFSQAFLWPAAMELCGLPLLDGGRMVVNAAHDEREPA